MRSRVGVGGGVCTGSGLYVSLLGGGLHHAVLPGPAPGSCRVRAVYACGCVCICAWKCTKAGAPQHPL